MKIPVLIPDMPKATDLLPYLKLIDKNAYYSNFGPLNETLETNLQRHFMGDCHVTTVANATLGIELVLSSLKLSPNAKVLLPSLSFAATATAVVRLGMQPLFSPIDTDSWLLTPDIAKKLLKKIPFDAVIPVASFGAPQNSVAWENFSKETGIPVLIDAAGAFGNQTIPQNIPVIFSMHATKALGAGEGGFVVANSPSLINEIKNLSNFGFERPGGDIINTGTNAKLSEYHAAIALCSLERWEQKASLRKNLRAYYNTRLSCFSENIKLQAVKNDNINTLMVIRLKTIEDAQNLIDELADKGIQTRRWYCPLLSDHPAFQHYKNPEIDLSETKRIVKQLLGLPFHLELDHETIDLIVNSLALSLEKESLCKI